MWFSRCIVLVAYVIAIPSFLSAAEPSPHKPTEESYVIGVIASLTGAAAGYGTAVLEGAELAVSELLKKGVHLELAVEDDLTVSQQTVKALQALKYRKTPDFYIGGTWWANSIVKDLERERKLFLSCETLFNEDYVFGNSTYALAGDLRDWVKVYTSLVDREKLQRGMILHYTSGFGHTLAKSFESLFTNDKREFLGSLTYSDFDMNEAPALLVRLMRHDPEVIFVDAQPRSFATFLKHLQRVPKQEWKIFTHSIVDQLLSQELLDLSQINNQIYFLRRKTFDDGFQSRFEKFHNKPPVLHADLGYYAVHLGLMAMRSSDPLQFLEENKVEIDGVEFKFNSLHVAEGIQQEVHLLEKGVVSKVAN